MHLKELRNQKNWSQDELAQLSGLSVRTIQRIEREHTAGLVSLKSLAAAFDIDVAELRKELNMAKGNIDTVDNDHEKQGTDKNRILRFYILSAGLIFTLIFPLMSALQDSSNWGPFVVMCIAWMLMIAVLALQTFDFFGNSSKEK